MPEASGRIEDHIGAGHVAVHDENASPLASPRAQSIGGARPRSVRVMRRPRCRRRRGARRRWSSTPAPDAGPARRGREQLRPRRPRPHRMSAGQRRHTTNPHVMLRRAARSPATWRLPNQPRRPSSHGADLEPAADSRSCGTTGSTRSGSPRNAKVPASCGEPARVRHRARQGPGDRAEMTEAPLSGPPLCSESRCSGSLTASSGRGVGMVDGGMVDVPLPVAPAAGGRGGGTRFRWTSRCGRGRSARSSGPDLLRPARSIPGVPGTTRSRPP